MTWHAGEDPAFHFLLRYCNHFLSSPVSLLQKGKSPKVIHTNPSVSLGFMCSKSHCCWEIEFLCSSCTAPHVLFPQTGQQLFLKKVLLVFLHCKNTTVPIGYKHLFPYYVKPRSRAQTPVLAQLLMSRCSCIEITSTWPPLPFANSTLTGVL